MPLGSTITAAELAVDGNYVDANDAHKLVTIDSGSATHVTISGHLVRVNQERCREVIPVTADIAPNPEIDQKITYINTSSTDSRILTGSWFGGDPSKTLRPGMAVTITKTAAGELFIISAYDNLSSGIGTMVIGTSFIIG